MELVGRRKGRAWLALMLMASFATPTLAGETKGFVVSWFNQAEYADPQGPRLPARRQ